MTTTRKQEAQKFYDNAKARAAQHLKRNEAADYINCLLIMNHYKKILTSKI